MKSTVFEDNNGALGLATSPKLTPRTRHICVKYNFFKEHCKPGGDIEIVKVALEFHKADIFAKGLTTDTFESMGSRRSHKERRGCDDAQSEGRRTQGTNWMRNNRAYLPLFTGICAKVDII
jgi:hypothetical protein